MNISAKMRERGILCTSLTKIKLTSIHQLMRISVVFILITIATLNVLMAFSVKGQDISAEKISMDLDHENLLTAIRKIEQQTSFRFYYRKRDVESAKSLSLSFGTRTISETLMEILKDSDLSFRQVENSVLIEKKSQQNIYEIRGRITGNNLQPLSNATISIRKINTVRLLQTSPTDSLGHFKLSVSEKGDYLIDITAIGTGKKTVSLALNEQKLTELEDIVLTGNANNLKEVIVVGKKAYIEQKIDRTIINVNELISNNGANALEVLEKSPGVNVDGNGTISFKGKPGVTVFIDGKPTYLSGTNLSNYLKSMPASLLDQIELMDNPPAKYDAAGDAGVINIKTRKSKVKGFNGAVSSSYAQARYGQTSESVNLNYRVDKINIFSGASYSLNRSFRQFGETREYFDTHGLLNNTFEENAIIKSQTNTGNLKLGMDYYKSPKTTWGIVFTGSVAPNSTSFYSDNQLLNKNLSLDSLIIADNNGKGHFNNGGVNLNYSHQFDSLGRGITFDLDGLTYNSINRQNFFNQTFDPSGINTNTQIITDHLPTSINIYSAKTDYVQPLKGRAKFEAGLKTSYIHTDNEANYFNIIDGINTADPNFTNHFLYNENVNSGYLNFNKSFKRFTLQTGLRVENTNAKGHQLGNGVQPDSSFSKSYTNLFPTAYLSYKLDTSGVNLLVASSGRRIRRPYYQDLNPFVTIVDKYSYFSGNPYLRPQYSDNYKLSYSYKSAVNVTLYYMRTTDLQYEVVRQEGSVFIDGTGNIGVAKYLGASFTLSLNFTKWWLSNTYIQVFNTTFKGQLFDTYLNTSKTMGEINMTNMFTLPGGWSAELSGFYVSKRANAQFANDATGQLNAGLQKKVLNNKGAIKLNVRDILGTYTNYGSTSNIPNATEAFRNKYNSQVFTLGFNYNFGSSVHKKGNRDTGSAEIEKGRIKQ